MSSEKQRTPEEEAALADFIRAIGEAETEARTAAQAGMAALPRLVKAAYGHDNSQAIVIMRWLASLYNGDNARPVQLDDVRRLDWSLQKDLIAAVLGCGNAGFPDKAIREAFAEQGGDAAVEALHWFSAGGPHRAALARLVRYVADHAHASSAGTIRAALRAIYNGSTIVPLGQFNYIDSEIGGDFVLVLDGVIGRDSGTIRENDIAKAFGDAGIPEALTEDEFPKGTRKQ